MSAKQNKRNDRIAMLGPRAQKTRSRIMTTLREMLTEKEYIAITTAELAKRAKVNEGLIYHYFKSKDDVFWSVLEDYMNEYIKFVELHTQGVTGTFSKIQKFIWANIYMLSREHPGGKILILEVRSNPNYYNTPAFALTVRSREILLEIIKQGIAAGEISERIHPYALASTIIGAFEHAVMPILTHKKDRKLEKITDEICKIVFDGICKKDDITINLVKKIDSIEKAVKKLSHLPPKSY
jgi:AcrR family transcriptional regulator